MNEAAFKCGLLLRPSIRYNTLSKSQLTYIILLLLLPFKTSKPSLLSYRFRSIKQLFLNLYYEQF